jgi:hypothetical protein
MQEKFDFAAAAARATAFEQKFSVGSSAHQGKFVGVRANN